MALPYSVTKKSPLLLKATALGAYNPVINTVTCPVVASILWMLPFAYSTKYTEPSLLVTPYDCWKPDANVSTLLPPLAILNRAPKPKSEINRVPFPSRAIHRVECSTDPRDVAGALPPYRTLMELEYPPFT